MSSAKHTFGAAYIHRYTNGSQPGRHSTLRPVTYMSGRANLHVRNRTTHPGVNLSHYAHNYHSAVKPRVAKQSARGPRVRHSRVSRDRIQPNPILMGITLAYPKSAVRTSGARTRPKPERSVEPDNPRERVL